jgi:hypothetical protein
MLPSSLSLGTDIFLQELDSADALERFQILTVPFFFLISLCCTFCHGRVATQIVLYLYVDGHIDTWRPCPFSEGTMLATWRSITVPDYVTGDTCRGACYVARLPFLCKKNKELKAGVPVVWTFSFYSFVVQAFIRQRACPNNLLLSPVVTVVGLAISLV